MPGKKKSRYYVKPHDSEANEAIQLYLGTFNSPVGAECEIVDNRGMKHQVIEVEASAVDYLRGSRYMRLLGFSVFEEKGNGVTKKIE